jgi:hypothetical protein
MMSTAPPHAIQITPEVKVRIPQLRSQPFTVRPLPDVAVKGKGVMTVYAVADVAAPLADHPFAPGPGGGDSPDSPFDKLTVDLDMPAAGDLHIVDTPASVASSTASRRRRMSAVTELAGEVAEGFSPRASSTRAASATTFLLAKE